MEKQQNEMVEYGKFSFSADISDVELALEIEKGEEYLCSLKNSIGEKTHVYKETEDFLNFLKQYKKKRIPDIN